MVTTVGGLRVSEAVNSEGIFSGTISRVCTQNVQILKSLLCNSGIGHLFLVHYLLLQSLVLSGEYFAVWVAQSLNQSSAIDR